MSMTAEEAIRNLRDAIRAEVLAEVIAKLTEYRSDLEPGTGGEGYTDGVDDAINTVEGM